MQKRDNVHDRSLSGRPKQLQLLNSSIVAKPPYCQGTLVLPHRDFILVYGPEDNARRVNLSTASITQLQHLADACTPATFGVGGEHVYDETYRKAGKLDSDDFLIVFDASRSSLVDAIRTELLVESLQSVKSEDLSIELYKLNVYGKDAFFKPHVDTPRSELMFGSLVIVFPTPHEGGALKLRAPGREEGETLEWTFDSSALLSQQAQPSIAYVAFFSDVEHEVMPVTSGHRVTITYNLLYALDNANGKPASSDHLREAVPKPISTNEQSFKDALHAVLKDPSFLPVGGNLMFSLRHQYPLRVAASYQPDDALTSDTTDDSDEYEIDEAVDEAAAIEKELEGASAALRALEPRLKASDGVVLRVLRACGLDASLKVLYEARESRGDDEPEYLIADGMLPLPRAHLDMGEALVDYLLDAGAEGVYEPSDVLGSGHRFGGSETPVVWVTGPPHARSGKGFQKTVQTHGNEPATGVVYWCLWIFARVGPMGQRETARV